MSAERIPQSTPPVPPERPRLVLTEYAPLPDKTAQRLKDSDRLFALCLLPALGLVALTCVGLSLFDLDHVQTPSDRTKPMRLQLYRPAIPVARKPQTPRLRQVTPARPHLAVRPPTHHSMPRVVSHPLPQPSVPILRLLTTPTPHAAPTPHPTPMPRAPQPRHVSTAPAVQPPPAPRPNPPAPRAPRPAPPVQTAPPAMSSGRAPSVGHTTHAGHAGPAFSTTMTGPVNVPLASGTGMQPTAPTQFVPDAAPAPRPVETPKPVGKPRAIEQPQPKPIEAPKPKPVEQPKPAHYVGGVDSREASVDDGSIRTPDADGIDSSALNGSCVISFEVDESGHLSSVKVKKSCGSPEMDQRCADAVRHGRGIPAVQDHIAYRARGQYTFSL